MAWDLTIGAVSKKSVIDQAYPVRIDLSMNGRSRMQFTTLWSANYIPDRFLEAIAYAQDGTTPIFGGVVLKRRVQTIGTACRFAEVECADFFTYLDWSPISLAYTAETTLKTVLTAIVAAVPAAHGITLDAAQVDGPNIDPFAWVNVKASAALRDLWTWTGYVATLSPLKVLKMVVPGTDAAPYTLTDGGTNCREIGWEDPDVTPANRIVLVCGPSGTGLATQRWTAGGVETSWVTDLEAVDPPPVLVEVDDGVSPRLAHIGAGGQFEWDQATHTLSLGTDPLPAAGTELVLGPSVAAGDNYTTDGYWAVYPFEVVATSGASPAITEVIAAPDITVYDQGVTAAAGLLAQRNQQPKQLHVFSLQQGWKPAQALTVNLTVPAVNATFTIAEVAIVLKTDGWWEYTFQASESTIYQGSHLDRWRDLVGGGGSTSSLSGAGGGSGSATVLSSPFGFGGTDMGSQLAADWTRFLNSPRYFAPASFSGRVRVELWARDATVGVKARLYNVTTAAEVAQSSEVTSQARTATSFVCVLLSGNEYELQIKATTVPGGTTASVYGASAQLEAA